jgi:hypothetical protein
MTSLSAGETHVEAEHRRDSGRNSLQALGLRRIADAAAEWPKSRLWRR